MASQCTSHIEPSYLSSVQKHCFIQQRYKVLYESSQEILPVHKTDWHLVFLASQ